MLLTVAVCTWNRAKLLDQTLERMRHLRVPPGVEWELLVVNNNCTDDTDAVIARHAGHLPLRRLLETKQGHSNARNCAIDHARGDLLIWTDDDVRVDPDWLEAYAAAAGRWPDAAYFGGRIRPWYEVEPPDWIRANASLLEGFLVTRDLGDTERPFEGGEHPFGANMAFRTHVLRRFRFDPQLGKVRDLNTIADETELLRRIGEGGMYGVWVPSAGLDHFFPRERMNREYFERYFFAGGITELRLHVVKDGYSPPPGPYLFGLPRWMWRRWTVCLARRSAARLQPGPGWVPAEIEWQKIRGLIHELRRLRDADAARRRAAAAAPEPAEVAG
jgi:glycosyltransferase involved in cell wall biosynthesis